MASKWHCELQAYDLADPRSGKHQQMFIYVVSICLHHPPLKGRSCLLLACHVACFLQLYALSASATAAASPADLTSLRLQLLLPRAGLLATPLYTKRLCHVPLAEALLKPGCMAAGQVQHHCCSSTFFCNSCIVASSFVAPAAMRHLLAAGVLLCEVRAAVCLAADWPPQHGSSKELAANGGNRCKREWILPAVKLRSYL